MFARLAPLEAKLAELDPDRRALDRFAERLEAVQGRLAAIEGAENPFAEISERLTRLHAQKDARSRRCSRGWRRSRRSSPSSTRRGALDRFAERLEAVQGRVALIEGAENPFAEISERLTRLHAQKDAAVETVMRGWRRSEAKLAELDPAGALDRFAERLEAVQGRVAVIEGGGEPVRRDLRAADPAHAQKDAAVETVFARLAPLEAKLAELDPRPGGALDRFAERLEAVQARVAVIEGGGEPGRRDLRAADPAPRPEGRAVEAVIARLAPLEAKLAELDPAARARPLRRAARRRCRPGGADRGGGEPGRRDLRAADPAPRPEGRDGRGDDARLAPLEAKLAELDRRRALDRFAERLEAVQARVAALEAAENPFAEISGRLTRLYAQKDATVEAVFARLAPLEAKLAEVGQGLARVAPLAEEDPRAALAGCGAARGAAVGPGRGGGRARGAARRAEGRDGEGGALAEIADRLTRLFAQKDAGLAASSPGSTPLEARLAALEARPGPGGRGGPRRGPGGRGAADRRRRRRRRDRALRRPDRRARGEPAAVGRRQAPRRRGGRRRGRSPSSRRSWRCRAWSRCTGNDARDR